MVKRLRRQHRRELEVFKGFHRVANLPIQVRSQCCCCRLTEVWSQCSQLTQRDQLHCSRLTRDACTWVSMANLPREVWSQCGRLTHRGMVTVWPTYPERPITVLQTYLEKPAPSWQTCPEKHGHSVPDLPTQKIWQRID